MTQTSDAIDTLGMWGAAAGLPEQAGEALERSKGMAEIPGTGSVDRVLLLGDGPGGLLADLIIGLCAPSSPIPIVAAHSYEIPAWVGSSTLAIGLSFSGATEETVAAATSAVEAGAHLVAVSSGGELAARAHSSGGLVLDLPSGLPQDRSAWAALAIPALVALGRIGVLPDAIDAVEHAIEQLRRRRDELVGDESPAEELARKIGRTWPLIHGARTLGLVAARWWISQINANAKSPAFGAALPDLCHDGVAGFGQHGDVSRQLLTLVNVHHGPEHPQIGRRFDLVTEVLREVVADVIDVQGAGVGALARAFDLWLVGDFVSLHLAARGVDPGPVPIIDELESALRT